MNRQVFPDVDVIIPFHRNDRLLREAIASAHASIGVVPHLILVNDTGEKITEETLGLTENDSLLMSRQRGYVGAMGTGIDSSKSPYVAFLDSDDLTHPHRLRKQIDRMQIQNVDYVSGHLRKFGKSTAMLAARSPFGKVPQCADPTLLLIIGAHGADSTIVAKGSSIRKTWSIHSDFSSSVADYGWLLSAIGQGYKLSHEEDAIYYYRSHPEQLSRDISLTKGWSEVWPMWDSFRKQKSLKLHNFARAKIDIQVALALAYPAALPRLNSKQVHALENSIHALLDDLKFLESDSLSDWRRTLWRRYLIAARFRGASKARYLLGVIFDVLIQFFSGIRFRANN
jgi:glycosyltransferase involved in cell wall biosynthesis